MFLRSIKVPKLSLQRTDYAGRVLIVGAGPAGLFAGYTLEYLQFPGTYEILEASDTFGGRVQECANYLDLPLDRGAEWIHGNRQVLQDLLLFPNDDASSIETIDYQPQTYFCQSSWFPRCNIWRHCYHETKFRTSTWFQYLETFIVPRLDRTKLVMNTAVTAIDYSNDVAIRVTTADGVERMVDPSDSGRAVGDVVQNLHSSAPTRCKAKGD